MDFNPDFLAQEAARQTIPALRARYKRLVLEGAQPIGTLAVMRLAHRKGIFNPTPKQWVELAQQLYNRRADRLNEYYNPNRRGFCGS